jgi:hypothetical protein
MSGQKNRHKTQIQRNIFQWSITLQTDMEEYAQWKIITDKISLSVSCVHINCVAIYSQEIL